MLIDTVIIEAARVQPKIWSNDHNLNFANDCRRLNLLWQKSLSLNRSDRMSLCLFVCQGYSGFFKFVFARARIGPAPFFKATDTYFSASCFPSHLTYVFSPLRRVYVTPYARSTCGGLL